jgi:hypothetical protein
MSVQNFTKEEEKMVGEQRLMNVKTILLPRFNLMHWCHKLCHQSQISLL